MASRDIRPYKSMSGHTELPKFQGPINASESFGEGEPLVFNAAGELAEAGDDPASVVGISAHRATDIDNIAFAAGTTISAYGVPDDQLYVCENFATDGAGTAATPTAANAIGVTGGLTFAGGAYSVDTGTGNTILEIFDVISTNTGDSISNPLISAHTADAVVFRFI